MIDRILASSSKVRMRAPAKACWPRAGLVAVLFILVANRFRYATSNPVRLKARLTRHIWARDDLPQRLDGRASLRRGCRSASVLLRRLRLHAGIFLVGEGLQRRH